MATRFYCSTIQVLLSIVAIPLAGACGEQTVKSAAPTIDHTKVVSVEAETNGIKARLTMAWVHGFSELPRISATVTLKSEIATNASSLTTKRTNDWYGPMFTYFVFERTLGPMELQDAKGQKLRTLKPKVTAADAYPSSASLRALWVSQRHGDLGRHKMPWVLTRSTLDLPLFNLRDYYEIAKPGDYQLTIWPKIYKKSDTNGDLLQRIGLPPISMTFKFDEN